MGDNIVSQMIDQHRNLKKVISNVVELSKEDNKEGEILQGLNEFKALIVKHLKLENEGFYDELIKQMEKGGQDITKTKTFIDEMKEIEKAVIAFLEDYSSEEKIKSNLEKFQKDIESVVSVLTLRIESEEAGVYSYWGLF
jgi:regulator of sigma D